MVVAVVSLVVALGMMLGELRLSRSHEKALRGRGAVEPPGDVYRHLAWVYPTTFVAMAIEGALAGPPPGVTALAGALLFAFAKALKFWAMGTLGQRWTFRVLVPPGAPLVTGGPYAWVRHPNYLALFGEVGGVALVVGALFTGAASLAVLGALVRKRIAVEEKALGHRQ